MKITISIFFLFFTTLIFCQENCFAYLENSPERKACELCDEALKHQQGSKESQLIFDKAIAIGPNFAWSYYQKSVPYLKRGFLNEGLQILNKAVKLKPLEYLCYRGYWYWQYKNYDLCIKDLETYYALPKAYLQFTPGGEKDMRLILGLAYAKNKNLEKGIKIIEDYIAQFKTEGDIGFSDYHTLAMIYTLNNQNDKAIKTMAKQLAINQDIPDSYYYLGLAYKQKSEFKNAIIYFKKALLKFKAASYYNNPNAGFRVYLEDVINEIDALKNKY